VSNDMVNPTSLAGVLRVRLDEAEAALTEALSKLERVTAQRDELEAQLHEHELSRKYRTAQRMRETAESKLERVEAELDRLTEEAVGLRENTEWSLNRVAALVNERDNLQRDIERVEAEAAVMRGALDYYASGCAETEVIAAHALEGTAGRAILDELAALRDLLQRWLLAFPTAYGPDRQEDGPVRGRHGNAGRPEARAPQGAGAWVAWRSGWRRCARGPSAGSRSAAARS
jgi:chromosome segregation ATPase